MFENILLPYSVIRIDTLLCYSGLLCWAHLQMCHPTPLYGPILLVILRNVPPYSVISHSAVNWNFRVMVHPELELTGRKLGQWPFYMKKRGRGAYDSLPILRGTPLQCFSLFGEFYMAMGPLRNFQKTHYIYLYKCSHGTAMATHFWSLLVLFIMFMNSFRDQGCSIGSRLEMFGQDQQLFKCFFANQCLNFSQLWSGPTTSSP